MRPTMYRSLAQSVGDDPSIMGYTIVVRSAAITPELTESVRKEIHALDPALAIDVRRVVRLEARGYRVWTQQIPATISPKNRLVIAVPLPPGTTTMAS